MARPQDATTQHGHFVHANGVNMYYEVHGQGEPLLLIHGGTVTAPWWQPYLAGFTEHYRVITPFSDPDDVLERANATHFGLAASVWTNNLGKGADIAAQLECGMAGVNMHGTVSPFAPFGGSKWSGIGYQNGSWGLEAFSELQVIEVART